MNNRITAVFDSHTQAQAAVDELRGLGITESHLSILSRQRDQGVGGGGGGGATVADRDKTMGDAADIGTGLGKGMLGGAGVGALFGLAAALIPGVGPFIAAGALATALGATGGAVAAGAIVGGASGAIAGALSKVGYSPEESEFFGRELEQGRVVVAVESGNGLMTGGNGGTAIDDARIREVLSRHGGRNATGSW